ncbi:MAG: crotonase/enoyl-CoA hydratase family protein [Pacificimonas sp.]
MTATLDMHEGTALITMDDSKANALSHDMLEALETAFDEAEKDADAIVITGREGKFCAGFDLKVMQGASPEDRLKLVTRGGKLGMRMFACPKPLVAAANGHGLAMGALMLLCCDTRVGAKGDYKFGLNETAIGMTMPTFGLELARHRLAETALTSAVIQARIYDPKGAAKVGFLDLTVDGDAVVGTSLEIAAMLGKLPADAYAANKKNVRAGAMIAMMG